MGISRFYTETAIIQRQVRKDDGAGYHTTEWQLLLEVKGNLDMVSGNKVYMAESTLIDYSHVFICGILPILVTPKDRMVIGNTVYNIVYVDNPVGRNHHQEILLSFKSLLNENAQEGEELAFHKLYSTSAFSRE